MTSGLVLTQLKEGVRLGAYHHMLPYLLPLGAFPFLSHSQFSCCLYKPCDFNHKAPKQRCATSVFYFKPNISFHLFFSVQTDKGFHAAQSLVYEKDLNPFDSCVTHIETNATISPPPVIHQCWEHWAQNNLLSCLNIIMTCTDLSPIWQQGPLNWGALAFLRAHGFVKSSGSGPLLSPTLASGPILQGHSMPASSYPKHRYYYTNLGKLSHFQAPCSGLAQW